MAQKTMNDHEVISAMADGQLQGDEFVRAMNLLGSSTECRSAWHAYHAVGDVMRMGDCQGIERDRAFVERLKMTLAQEPSPSNGAATLTSGSTQRCLEPNGDPVPVGNEAQFRWKAWGAVASVFAISFLAWQMLISAEEPRGLAQNEPSTASTLHIAQAPGENALSDFSGSVEEPVMIRDPRLDALLAAHQQLGGASAFQHPTGFVRSATFTGAGR